MPDGFFYFSLSENFESIIRKGILSRVSIVKSNNQFRDFSNQEVQVRRQFRDLHKFVPLYFVTRTPTLYSRINLQDKIFFVEVSSDILNDSKKIILFSDGNSASGSTRIFSDRAEAQRNIDWNVLVADYWNDFEDGRRKRCAEVLVYDKVEPIWFDKVIVNNPLLYNAMKDVLDKMKWKGLKDEFKLELNQNYFF